MPLTAKASVVLDANLTLALDLAQASAPLQKIYGAALANGTGAGQADKIFHDQRTIAASGTDDLDLNGPGLTDAFGVALAFVKIKAVIISAAAANANNVQVGAAAANGFISWAGSATDKVIVRPGATFALIGGQTDATGYAVTAATADLLRITNGGAGTSVTYDVIIIGTSA